MWLWVAAAFGVAWNVFGLVQLADFVGQTRDSLMMKGMTPSATDPYYALPVWMKLAFGSGSVGGLVGIVALAMHRPVAVAILAASLLGYVALFAVDYAYGVFDAIPGQMAVPSVVVLIADALLATGLRAKRQAQLG